MGYIGHDDGLTKIYASSGIYGLCRHVTTDSELHTIVDLGAHHGHGYAAFGVDHPDALYVMVEPVADCVEKIKEVISNNPTARINIVDGILGKEAGTAEINLFESDGRQSSNLFSTRGGVYGRSCVQVIKVHPYDVVPMSIDFAKVNIEGGEYQLVQDGFFDRIDQFVMEVHNELIPNVTYVDILTGPLSADFELITCGSRSYKYCFCVGHRIRRS